MTHAKALNRIKELEAELKVSDKLLEDRDTLLETIPQCPVHGKCVPYAIEWIEQVKTLAKIIVGSNYDLQIQPKG